MWVWCNDGLGRWGREELGGGGKLLSVHILKRSIAIRVSAIEARCFQRSMHGFGVSMMLGEWDSHQFLQRDFSSYSASLLPTSIKHHEIFPEFTALHPGHRCLSLR